MPIFRIVYIDDDSFAPRCLTAEFPDRAAAELAIGRHGHRVVHVAPLAAGDSVTDPIRLTMSGASAPAESAAVRPPEEARRGRRLAPFLREGLAGVAVAVAGLAVVGAGFFLL